MVAKARKKKCTSITVGSLYLAGPFGRWRRVADIPRAEHGLCSYECPLRKGGQRRLWVCRGKLAISVVGGEIKPGPKCTSGEV